MAEAWHQQSQKSYGPGIEVRVSNFAQVICMPPLYILNYPSFKLCYIIGLTELECLVRPF